MKKAWLYASMGTLFFLIVLTLGCGSDETGPAEGILRLNNNGTVPIYNMNTKPAGGGDWENITPSINNGGSKLDPGFTVDVPVPVGTKDFKYTYFDSANNAVEKYYANAFTITESTAVNADIIAATGASFSTIPVASGGGGSGGGTAPSGCNNSLYNAWMNYIQTAQVPIQAGTHCAAGWAYICIAGDTVGAQKEFDNAGSLGTNCNSSPPSR